MIGVPEQARLNRFWFKTCTHTSQCMMPKCAQLSVVITFFTMLSGDTI